MCEEPGLGFQLELEMRFADLTLTHLKLSQLEQQKSQLHLETRPRGQVFVHLRAKIPH